MIQMKEVNVGENMQILGSSVPVRIYADDMKARDPAKNGSYIDLINIKSRWTMQNGRATPFGGLGMNPTIRDFAY